MEKYVIIYNPHAGGGTAKETAQKLTDILSGDSLDFKDMTEISDYSEFFKEIGDDEKLVVAGGDGTLNRFINETDGVEYGRDIYYYAAGSGNDFMRDIGGDIGGAPVCITPYLKNLPSVTINGKTSKFINGVGYGLDGYCCEVGDHLRETSNKPVNYTSVAIKGLLFYYKPANAKITVDGKEYEFKKVWVAPTMKGRFYGGGMMPTPKQDRANADGKLSLMVLHDSGSLHTLMVFPSIFKGEHVKHDKIFTVIEGKEMTVRFDKPTALQIDGETVLGVTEYTAKA